MRWSKPCHCAGRNTCVTVGLRATSSSCAPRALRFHATCSADRGERASSERRGKPAVGLGLKSVWHGAEALGKLVGGGKGAAAAPPPPLPPSTSGRLPREEAIAALRQDYDVNYFISGRGAMAAYDPQCRFADDFAAFDGVERFKTNVRNLGGMLEAVELDVTAWEELPDALRTGWRFNAILSLFPWRPRLAAAGRTTHRFDPETGLVVEHLEEWNVEPARVLRALLKPSSSVPRSQWDVLMNAVHDGDGKGIWLALSPQVLAVATAGAAASLLTSVSADEGVSFQAAAFAGVAAAAAVTELVKVTTGMMGGGT